MRRTLVLALGLMVVPAMASAQVELGFDFFGVTYNDTDGAQDATIGVSLPLSGLRVGFMAGPQMIIETRMGFDWEKEGDASGRSLTLVPGLNYLVNDQIYVRGEAGLENFSFDNGAGTSFSGTQYVFGAGLGTRRPFGMGILRLEAGVQKALENTNDGIPSSLNIYGSAGASIAIN
ncbi:MAG: hypothetical protein ABL963_01855 [Longimicrobiales bacterium]